MDWFSSAQASGNQNTMLQLLGECVMARDFDRQVAELQIRAAILNRFTQLGTPVTVAMP